MALVNSAEVKLSSGRSFALIDLTGAWIKNLVLDGEKILKDSVDGKRTHGGACSLIPFAGRVRNAAYRFDGIDYTLTKNNGNNSIHGFIRDVPFNCLQGDGENNATFSAEASNGGYPTQIEVSISMHLEDSRFKTAYRVRNTGEKRAPLVIGCHPYFLAGSPCRLLHNSRLERLVFTDQYFPDGTVANADFNSVKDLGELKLDSCFRNGGTLTFIDNERELIIRRNNMDYFLLYNGKYCDGRSVAIEPMTGAPDAFNNGIGLHLLEPGEVFGCSFEIEFRRR